MFPNSTVNPSKILITVQKRLVILGNFNKKIETVHTACLFHSELTKFSETFHKILLFRRHLYKKARVLIIFVVLVLFKAQFYLEYLLEKKIPTYLEFDWNDT